MLAAVGGLEHAALAGFVLAGALLALPVLQSAQALQDVATFDAAGVTDKTT